MRLTWTATLDDALAYERLPREIAGWSKAAFFALPVLVGAAFALLFDELAGVARYLVLVGLVLLSWLGRVVAINLLARRRANRRAARSRAFVVEDRGDRLVIAGGDRAELAMGDVGKVLVEGDRVFVMYQGDALIVPQRAFDTAQAMKAWGEDLDRRSQAAAT